MPITLKKNTKKETVITISGAIDQAMIEAVAKILMERMKSSSEEMVKTVSEPTVRYEQAMGPEWKELMQLLMSLNQQQLKEAEEIIRQLLSADELFSTEELKELDAIHARRLSGESLSYSIEESMRMIRSGKLP
ncbi:MAG: hypothetical protein M3R08_05780 [Bacteroidota bacterium]|nr:hypothetical protein [Bacteroidota bacterium]